MNDSKQKTAPALDGQAQVAMNSEAIEPLRQKLPDGERVLMIDNYE